MPMIPLVLAEPPEVQQLPVPESYQEARQALYITGKSLVDVIAAQPPQESNGQVITAEIIKGVGNGLTLVIPNTPEKAGQPSHGDAQFSLSLGGELQLAFGNANYSPDSDICQAIDAWRHAGFWWLARDEVQPSSSTDQLVQAFVLQKEGWARSDEDDRLKAAIQQAVTGVVSEMFDVVDGDKLFNELRIGWRGADQCFAYARDEAREAL